MSWFSETSHLRARLGRSDWIVCAEALKMLDDASQICGATSMSGPNGEPLACGYRALHQGPHAWSTLPTWTTPAAPLEPGDAEAHAQAIFDVMDAGEQPRPRYSSESECTCELRNNRGLVIDSDCPIHGAGELPLGGER